MLKLNYTREEADEIKNKLFLSEIQEKIFEYRLREYTITKMATIENCSESTISREIKKLSDKLEKLKG